MLQLALVGCGGMGCRHVRGLDALRRHGLPMWELAAVCDPMPANAAYASDLAENLFGRRPRVLSAVEELASAADHIDAAIVATAPTLHADIGCAAFELGLHVMVEKPLALTVRQGAALVEAAGRANRSLAVAENYRRDPMNRLAKALLDTGVLGPIHVYVQASSGSGERVIITPWRHRKRSGGIVVDMGIHYADLMEYFLGPIDLVFGLNTIVDQQRVDDTGNWHDADAEDLSVGVVRFACGAIGNWLINMAGRGAPHFSRTAYGRHGTLSIPHDRSGRPLNLTLRQDGIDTMVSPEDQLALIPDFALDDVTATLFGGERMTSYAMDYPDIDANLLAIEQADFAAAIEQRRPPEVDGSTGLRSLAISYGFLEAERLGRVMRVDELLDPHGAFPYQGFLDQEP